MPCLSESHAGLTRVLSSLDEHRGSGEWIRTGAHTLCPSARVLRPYYSEPSGAFCEPPWDWLVVLAFLWGSLAGELPLRARGREPRPDRAPCREGRADTGRPLEFFFCSLVFWDLHMIADRSDSQTSLCDFLGGENCSLSPRRTRLRGVCG